MTINEICYDMYSGERTNLLSELKLASGKRNFDLRTC